MINPKRGEASAHVGLGVQGLHRAAPASEQETHKAAQAEKSKKEKKKEESKPPQKEEKPLKKKKKRHGCRNCLLVFLIFNLLLFGGVYFVGDYFTRQYVGLSLWNCFGILYDATHASGGKIVKNKYADSDYAALDAGLKQQLFLKADVDLDIEQLAKEFLEKKEDDGDGEGEGGDEVRETALMRTISTLGASAGTDAMVDKLSELYSRDNIDLQRLDAYDESLHDSEYTLKITDKMVAALLNRVVGIVNDVVPQVGEKLDEFGIENISDVVRVEQVIFGTRNGAKNGEKADVTAATLTLSVNARKVLNAAIRQKTGKDLSLLVNIVLPKRMYATACVPLEQGATLDHYLYLNNMNDKKMDRAYKLIAKILDLTGSNLDVKQKIDEVVQKNVVEKLDKVNKYVPLSSAKDGKLTVDVFETVIEATKLNQNEDGTLKPTEKQIHATDVIQTLAGVVASDADKATVEQYDFMHQYREDATNKVVYKKTAPEEGSGFYKVDYKQAFMDELASKYMLDLRGKDGEAGTEDDIDFDRLMRLFGLGEKKEGEDELELLDLFDASKLKDVPEGEEARVKIDTRMLGAILQSQIDTLIDGESTIGKYNPVIEYVVTYRTTVEGTRHTMLRTAITIGTQGLLPEGNAMSSIVSGLIGDKITVTFDVDITPSTEEGFPYLGGKVAYNDLTGERTQNILRVIGCFADDFDKDSLLSQIEQPVRDAIGKMGDVLPIEIGISRIDVKATAENLPELTKENSAEIGLPTVYGTIKQMLFADDDEQNGEINKTITEAGIEDVLHAVSEAGVDRDGSSAAFEKEYVGDAEISTTTDENGDKKPYYGASLQKVLNAYYVRDPARYTSFDALFGEGGIANADAFTADKFDFDTLFHDDKPIEEMKPLFTDNDIGALLIEKMSGDAMGLYENLTDVRGIRIYMQGDEHMMSLIVKLNAAKLFDKKGDGQNQYEKLLPADSLFLKATVHLDEYGYYDKVTGNAYASKEEADAAYAADPENVVVASYYMTTLTVNHMDDAVKYLNDPYGTMVKMVKSMGGENGIDFDTVARDLGAAMRGRIEELESSLGGGIEFVDGGIRLVSFYEFLKKSLLPDDDTVTANELRAALQGLQRLRESGTNSDYNYDGYVFDVNPIVLESGQVTFAEVDLDMSNLSFRATDNVFGRGLQNGFAIRSESTGFDIYKQDGLLASGGDTFRLAQLNILHNGLKSRADYLQSYYYGGESGLTDIETSTHIEFNFAMRLQNVMGSDSKLSGALPETVYVTVLFRQNAAKRYERVYFRVNAMTKVAQDVLFKIAHIQTDDESDIGKKLAECDDALNNQYNGATFGDATPTQSPCFGTISVSFGG